MRLDFQDRLISDLRRQIAELPMTSIDAESILRTLGAQQDMLYDLQRSISLLDMRLDQVESDLANHQLLP